MWFADPFMGRCCGAWHDWLIDSEFLGDAISPHFFVRVFAIALPGAEMGAIGGGFAQAVNELLVVSQPVTGGVHYDGISFIANSLESGVPSQFQGFHCAVPEDEIDDVSP